MTDGFQNSHQLSLMNGVDWTCASFSGMIIHASWHTVTKPAPLNCYSIRHLKFCCIGSVRFSYSLFLSGFYSFVSFIISLRVHKCIEPLYLEMLLSFTKEFGIHCYEGQRKKIFTAGSVCFKGYKSEMTHREGSQKFREWELVWVRLPALSNFSPLSKFSSSYTHSLHSWLPENCEGIKDCCWESCSTLKFFVCLFHYWEEKDSYCKT